MNNLGFSYLLNSLNISPSKMGKELNVDRTLVSKWKNGSRKIDSNAIYFDNALSFLIQKNTELGNNFLENLFTSIYNESINYSNYDSHLKELLKRFIVYDSNKNIDFKNNILKNNRSENNSLYSANISIYNNKTFLGILDMLDTAINYGDPQNLYVVFNKSFDSFVDNKEFRDNWLSRIIKLLDMGYTLYFIYSSSKSSKLLSYFTSLLLHKNCKASYFIDSIDDTYNYSLHIVENQSVFFSSCQFLDYEAYNYGALFTDPVTINFYIAFTKNILSKSLNTFIPITISQVLTTLDVNSNKINKELIKYNTTYYYNFFPIYTVMSDELYYEILCNSVENEDDISKYFEQFKIEKNNMYKNSKMSCIHFYSIDKLLEFSKMETIIYDCESDMAPKLILTKQQFKEHLEFLVKYLLSNDSYRICLVSETSNNNTELFYCWCKKNEFLLVLDSNNLSDIRLCNDISLVNSVAHIFEHHFLFALENFKDKTIVSNFLRTL